MRQNLVIAVFVGTLVMMDGAANNYRITNMAIAAGLDAVHGFTWLVSGLLGLAR